MLVIKDIFSDILCRFYFLCELTLKLQLFNRENKVQKKSGFAGVEEHP